MRLLQGARVWNDDPLDNSSGDRAGGCVDFVELDDLREAMTPALATACYIPIGKVILTAYVLSRYLDCDDILVDAAQDFLNAALGKAATDDFIESIDIHLC